MFTTPPRRTLRQRRLVTAIGVSLALLATSCGGDDDDSSDTAAPAATDAGDETDAPASTDAPTATEASAATSEPSATDASAATDAGATASDAPVAADDGLEPIKVGFASNDSGSTAQPDATEGIKAGVAYVNAELGGIDGHPIELVTCSAGTDPESNQSCGQEFANDPDLDLVVTGLMYNGASFYNAVVASSTPILNTTYLTPADIATPGPTAVYSGGQLVTYSMGSVLKEIVPDLKTVGVLQLDTPVSATGTENAKRTLGPDVEVKVAVVPVSSPDVLGSITALGDVDGYINLLQPDTCIQSATALATIAPDVPVVTTVSCADGPIVQAVGDAVDGWYVSTPNKVPTAADGDTDADIALFKAKYEEYGGDPKYAGARFAGAGFGMAVTMARVLTPIGADNLSPESITEAITSFTGPVMMGPPDISCPGELAANLCTDQVYVYEVVDGALAEPSFGGGLVEVHVS